MNLFFTILLILIGIGGGIALIVIFDEYDKKTTIGFMFLMSCMGVLVSIWGLLLYLNNSSIHSTLRGPISGPQLIIVGALLAIFSGYLGIR